MNLELPEEPDHIVLVIGERGDLTPERLRAAAKAFVLAFHAYPVACFVIVLDGFDDDIREVWEIPEAREAFRVFAHYVANGLPGTTIHDWRLDPVYLGVLAMCLGIGVAKPYRDGWTIEVRE